MTILVTGAAGFIGFHVCDALLKAGHAVIGVDTLNSYYDPALKRARLAQLAGRDGFRFAAVDVADPDALAAVHDINEVERIIHLAAQAGVRYSLENPFAYARANLTGHLSILELARQAPRLERLVYASSSSVYGDAATAPFSETVRVDQPVSLYAATKAADELMSSAYAHLYQAPTIGLRFFTVYGPWGRPDMAYWLFTDAILRGEPIRVFNNGEMRRDFTYIDDIVDGVLRTAFQPVALDPERPHAVYNIGHSQPAELGAFIALLEARLGRTADKRYEPMQPGDVQETCADISAIERDFGWRPTTSLEEGLDRFVAWFQNYRAARACAAG